MLILFLIAAIGSCECQSLSVADGCGPTTGPYSSCDYYQAVVDCNASACAYIKIAHARTCNLLCNCAPFCSASMIQDNTCQEECFVDSCLNDGGDCEQTTLSNCTTQEVLSYDACMKQLVPNQDECIYSNDVLTCLADKPCFASRYQEYCQLYSSTYTSCAYDCSLASASTIHIGFVLSFLL
jgi:hypothetical protein